MKFYIGVTDKGWFDFLAAQAPDEVNFWKPGGNAQFGAVEPGSLFLFKLHKPHHFIVGGGFFVRSSILPVSVAWEAFGPKNGTPDQATLLGLISHYKGNKGTVGAEVGRAEADPFIGCVVLTQPFFLPRDQWIPAPTSWANSIVQGKTYNTAEPEGQSIWSQVQVALNLAGTGSIISEGAGEAARYGQPRMVKQRLGQGGFRVAVTEAYQRRCAFTGEKTLPVLDAAHIRPYAKNGPHETGNGLLLRSDLHILFDRGLIALSPDLRIEVSSHIKSNYGNGRHYYALHGQPLLTVPQARQDQPQREYLEWHLKNIFKP